MNKNEFIIRLRQGLSSLRGADVDKSVDYYTEIIEDRIEAGQSEEEAIASLGSIDEIISQTLDETGDQAPIVEKIKNIRKMKRWEKVVLIAGSPLWLVLLISLVAVAASLIASLWAICISFCAIELSLLAGSLAGVICTFIMLFTGRMYQGLLLLGAALLCLGLGILLFKLTIQCVKLMATGTVKTFVACKHALVGKEDTNEK